MTTNNAPQKASGDPHDEIVAHVQRYTPRVLSKNQCATMLDDMRAVVLRALPSTKQVAGNFISILAAFVKDVTPVTGGKLSDYLTDANVSSWLSSASRSGANKHTLRTRRGTMDRLVRAEQGLPAKVNGLTARDVAPAPLRVSDLQRLVDACHESGPAAIRGFVAVFGTGLTDAQLVGGTFTTNGSRTWLRHPGGRIEVVSAIASSDLALEGSKVLHGDWNEVKVLANTLGIHLDWRIVKQTFRMLAVAEDLELVEIVRRFRLNEVALSAIIPYLSLALFHEEADYASFLRNGTSARSSDLPLISGEANAPHCPLGHIAVGRPVTSTTAEVISHG